MSRDLFASISFYIIFWVIVYVLVVILDDKLADFIKIFLSLHAAAAFLLWGAFLVRWWK